MQKIIKLGYLLSYDYEYIFNSLSLVYDYADVIYICFDKDSKTWTGQKLEIPENIFSKIKSLDIQNKISFYSDSFYIPNTPPIDLETRQRNMLAEKMGKGGWHIQIDSDEYPLYFKELCSFLRKHKYLLRNPHKTPANFFVKFITLFRKTENGFLAVTPYQEPCFLITNLPDYFNARYPKNPVTYHIDSYIIHQSWARDEDEIYTKIKNWGHTNDFDVDTFYSEWKDVSLDNYSKLENFHPLNPEDWQSLEFIEAKNIDDLIATLRKKISSDTITFPLKFKKRLKLMFKSYF